MKDIEIMRKIKIFISSVIENYEDRSDAAEQSIIDVNRDHNLNFEVIRINSKKHPAMNKSPQQVCLDAVKECEIYLGIYPKDKYGWDDSPIGISPTHEEFRQAVKENKCCLIFIENNEKINQRQKKFLKEVGNYTKGYFWNEFESGNVDQLKYMIYRKLSNIMKVNFEEYLPYYLKSLLLKYKYIIRPWEEEIGSLHISEIVPLELREEQKENKQSRTEYNRDEKYYKKFSKTQPFFDAIKKNQRLLILGDPGAGKSTSLQWVTYSYVKQINSYKKEFLIPIYLELKLYRNNILELIRTCFGVNGIVCNEETLENWIKNGKFLFIFDGFDEVTEPSKCLCDIKQIIGLSRENRFIVASRKIENLIDFQSLGFKKAEIKQLSDSQIELFIEKYLEKDKRNRLLKELTRYNLLNEARNPLILWLMTLEYKDKKCQISINKGMLFKNVIEQYFLKKWERKVIPNEHDIQKYADLKIKVLSKLAFFTIEEESSIKIEEGKAKEIIDFIIKDGRTNYKDLRDEILVQLFKSHLLIKTGSQISFWHKSFRDYFAALELKRIFLKDHKRFMKCYISKKWEESIIFLVGIMDNSSDLVVHLIQPFWKYFLKRFPFELSLAAKCMGTDNRVNIELQQKIIQYSTKIIQNSEKINIAKNIITNLKSIFFPIFFDIEEAFQALGEMKSEKSTEALVDFFENHECNALIGISGNRSCYYCQLAAEALKNASLTKKIQNSLLYTALHHQDGVVRNELMDFFRENMTQEMASQLVEVVLNKNEKDVIHRGVYRESYGLVIEDYPVRCVAIDIICGNCSDELKYPEITIDPLIQIALENESDSLRDSAKLALSAGHSKPEYYEKKIIDKLVSHLNKKYSPLVRGYAATALVHHFSPKVRKALIQALDDENAEVKIRAATALIYVGVKTEEERDEASRRLFKLFDNENLDVKANAICAYGLIQRNPSDKEISQIINLLKNKSSWIRCAVVEVLGRLEVKNALGALKQMVEDEKYVYPWAYAIWAILQIEPSFSEVIKKKGWEYPYITILSDDDIDNRRMAIKVLRRIGTEISLPFLKKIDENIIKNRDISGELFYAINDIEARIK